MMAEKATEILDFISALHQLETLPEYLFLIDFSGFCFM